MRARQLEVFIAVMRAGTVTAAAAAPKVRAVTRDFMEPISVDTLGAAPKSFGNSTKREELRPGSAKQNVCRRLGSALFAMKTTLRQCVMAKDTLRSRGSEARSSGLLTGVMSRNPPRRSGYESEQPR